MPVQLVYDGFIEPIPTTTTGFGSNGFIYFEAPGLTSSVDVVVELKVTLPNGGSRIVPVGCIKTQRCQTRRTVSTDQILDLPPSLLGSDRQLQLTLSSLSSFTAQVWHYTWPSKVDDLVAAVILGTPTDLGTFNITTTAAAFLPVSTGIRGGLLVFNPSTVPVAIGFLPTNLFQVIPPGQTATLGPWQGEVYAQSIGGAAQLQVVELRE